MQIDRNEKGLLTPWTRQPYYRTGEAHIYTLGDTTLSIFIAISANFTSPTGRG